MASVRSAVIFSSLSSYLVKILAFVSVITFSRLLTPSELGVFAIASSLTMVMAELRLLGTSNYLVREKEITRSKVASGVGLTMLVSWSLGAGIFVCSGFISNFYGIADLAYIFRILTVGFLLAPFISVMSSLLSRSLMYKHLMLVRLSTQVTTFLTSLVLVLLDFSYFGLAIGITAGVMVEFLILLLFKPDLYSWRPSFKGLRPIAKFGIYTSITNLLQRFDSTLPDIVIGKMGTPANVAMFSRGSGFLLFLTQILVMGSRPVALPYLSMVQREGGCLKTAYIKATLLLGAICWPVLIVAGIASEPAILLMFGEQWRDAIPIVSILVYWALFRIVHTLSPSLLMAANREGLMLAKQAIVFTVTLLGIIIAFPYGLKAVAKAMVIAGVLDFLLSSVTLFVAIGLSLFEFIRAVFKNIVLCVVCGWLASMECSAVEFESYNHALKLLVIAAILVPSWCVFLFLLKHPLSKEISRFIDIVVSKIRSAIAE